MRNMFDYAQLKSSEEIVIRDVMFVGDGTWYVQINGTWRNDSDQASWNSETLSGNAQIR